LTKLVSNIYDYSSKLMFHGHYVMLPSKVSYDIRSLKIFRDIQRNDAQQAGVYVADRVRFAYVCINVQLVGDGARQYGRSLGHHARTPSAGGVQHSVFAAAETKNFLIFSLNVVKW